MHRYKIFLISGETIEVEAKSVFVASDKQGIRFDFLTDDVPRFNAHPSAVFYSEYIMGWAELPENNKQDIG